MKNKKILALDLGTKTGWAVCLADQKILSGTENFKSTRFEGGGMRYLRFKSWLDEMGKLSDGISQIYFEEVRRHIGVDDPRLWWLFSSSLILVRRKTDSISWHSSWHDQETYHWQRQCLKKSDNSSNQRKRLQSI